MKYVHISILLFALMFPGSSRSQPQPSELDQLKYVPSIDETGMRTIAITVWELFDKAIETPDSASTARACEELIWEYFDTDFEGRHDRLKEYQGRKYNCGDRKELLLNNRLLFNLHFDADGNLVLPDTIHTIFHRLEEKEGKVLVAGLLSFDVPVSEEARVRLGKVRLERPVKNRPTKIDMNPPTVAVKVPFNLARREKTRNVTGRVLLEGRKITFLPEEKSSIDEDKTALFKALGQEINDHMLRYKKGEFTWVIEHLATGYQVDLNIRRNTIWSSQQTKIFTVDTYKVLSFGGKGERTKQAIKAQREFDEQVVKALTPVKK